MEKRKNISDPSRKKKTWLTLIPTGRGWELPEKQL